MTRDEQTAISSAELQELVLPGMANHHGTLFAGLGLQLMAKAAFMAARKLARREVVMAGASGIDFMRPIPVGRTLALRAWVSRVGRSSMTVCISGFAEAPGARREEVIKGVFVMVAVDGQGRPAAIDAARAHAHPCTANARSVMTLPAAIRPGQPPVLFVFGSGQRRALRLSSFFREI